jgi:hypothetical protein
MVRRRSPAGRKTADKARTKSAAAMAMPMLRLRRARGYHRRPRDGQSRDRCQTDLLQRCTHETLLIDYVTRATRDAMKRSKLLKSQKYMNAC